MTLSRKIKRAKINAKVRWRSLWLNIGCALVRYGSIYKIGDPIRNPAGISPNIKTRVPTFRAKGSTHFIKNIYFNYRTNSIEYDLSKTPLKQPLAKK